MTLSSLLNFKSSVPSPPPIPGLDRGEHIPYTHHSWKGWKGKGSQSALSALTLLAFLFFLNILQSCLRDQMQNQAPVVVMMTTTTTETKRTRRASEHLQNNKGETENRLDDKENGEAMKNEDAGHPGEAILQKPKVRQDQWDQEDNSDKEVHSWMQSAFCCESVACQIRHNRFMFDHQIGLYIEHAVDFFCGWHPTSTVEEDCATLWQKCQQTNQGFNLASWINLALGFQDDNLESSDQQEL